MADKVFNVLFICRHNDAVSLMAEALLTMLGKHHFMVYSAGTEPAEVINPLAMEAIRNAGLPTEGLQVKGLDCYADAPLMDFVFTVGDGMAAGPLPILGHPMAAHWPIIDPTKVTGSHAEQAAAFAESFKMICRRIELFVELPLSSLDRLALQRSVDEIGTAK